jgi:hypothetical protein
MGLMDKIKEMFGGGHEEHGEKAGQQPDTARQTQTEPGQDSSQFQSGQGEQYPAGADADAFGSVTGRASQPEDTQLEQAESDMESEGGHEWEQ